MDLMQPSIPNTSAAPIMGQFPHMHNMMPTPMPVAQPFQMTPSPHPKRESRDHHSVREHAPPSIRKYKAKKKPNVDENGKRIIRRRKRKSYEQLQMLIKEFLANPDWSKENMQEVSRKTGLSEAQVYKWGWDQRRKMMDPTHDIHTELKMYKRDEDIDDDDDLECDESITKLKLPVTSSKKRKISETDEIQKEPSTGNKYEKSLVKTKRNTGSGNKENEYNRNGDSKMETRGVKRKLIHS